jgi:hypothetical protein
MTENQDQLTIDSEVPGRLFGANAFNWKHMFFLPSFVASRLTLHNVNL